MYSVIVYDVRNLTVMDEEETRLFETEEVLKERLEEYKECGVSETDLKKIEQNLYRLFKEEYKDSIEHLRLCREIRDVLLRYIKIERESIENVYDDLDSFKETLKSFLDGKKLDKEELVTELWSLYVWIEEIIG